MLVIILLLLIFIILMYNYYVYYTKDGQLINLIPGQLGYPIIGNALQFLGSREEQWKKLVTLANQYVIFKYWIFFLPIVSIIDPNDVEKILSNTIHIEKSAIYDIAKPWLGTSLGISKGDKWHSRRKILTPSFHFNILQQFTEILIEQSKNMTKCLKNTEGTVVKDLISFVSEHTLNAICETAMGTSLQDLNAFQQQYRKSVHRMTELIIYRFFRPWLHFDWIFSLTSKGREQTKILKILHKFTEQIIAERRLYHERTKGQYLKEFDNLSAQRDDNETIETRRKRLSMLDLLIAAPREDLMTDIDIREEVDAFVFAGYDTTAAAVSFILAQLAEHKDIQDRIRNEVDSAIQGNEEKFTFKFAKLQQLQYLERCIKEALRLYPSVPFISRICGEDVKLQSYLIPAGTTHINIYAIHRNPNFWPNPEVFNPDRFLPEQIRNRHPYSYIPFSAGPRNCIGQRFAMLEMKAMIASVIHNFYLEPIDYLKDVQLQTDITLCPTRSLRIKFIPIHKINVST
ncbi:PREDICTED: cytochrome P450 4C1 [Trachymyrmex cornetzi]|uniref:cytochrome P450 4C1 n=1 Tax=Trachymyrmex cornetzi TaxID=471704 RepID=UPI00084F1FA1|nr:PREDICTED: cytochrome P450 4C1 [Trachymyrmex cornetzi]